MDDYVPLYVVQVSRANEEGVALALTMTTND